MDKHPPSNDKNNNSPASPNNDLAKNPSGSDGFNDGFDHSDPLKPLNVTAIPKRQTAVALLDRTSEGKVAQITAAGRGKLAEEIIRIALDAGIKLRQDADLAELLAEFEIDSPIPSEALMAVGEILAYIYRANGQPNPFDTVLKDADPKDPS